MNKNNHLNNSYKLAIISYKLIFITKFKGIAIFITKFKGITIS